MEKDADAFRTISEVGEDLDLPQHVLRFWETRFTQIKPIKRGGGRRYYRPDDVDLLRGIKHLLYAEGFTIKGVQRILREESPRYVQAVGREGRMPPLGEAAGGAATHTVDVGFGELPDEPDDAIAAPVPPSVLPVEPVATAQRRIEPAFGSGPVGESIQLGAKTGRHEPAFTAPAPQQPEEPAREAEEGPALFAVEPAPMRAVRPNPKPKQLALFEGMGDEGLSAKDRETLRQALERIDECRKILSSADLAKTPLNTGI